MLVGAFIVLILVSAVCGILLSLLIDGTLIEGLIVGLIIGSAAFVGFCAETIIETINSQD